MAEDTAVIILPVAYMSWSVVLVRLTTDSVDADNITSFLYISVLVRLTLALIAYMAVSALSLIVRYTFSDIACILSKKSALKCR